jgi:hypothetical protein
MGTALVGFMLQGIQDTLAFRYGHASGGLPTRRHRSTADARYTAAQQIQLTIRPAQSNARAKATMLKGYRRMIDTWYYAHCDGGSELVQMNVAS